MTTQAMSTAVARPVARRASRGPVGPSASPPVHASAAAAGSGDAGLRDPVTARHDAIDFARAIVADGGTSTAGLAMLRGELQHIAAEVRRMREEFAAVRSDVERVRLDLLQLQQFTRGVLVDRLAVRFSDIDRRFRARNLGAGNQTCPGDAWGGPADV